MKIISGVYLFSHASSNPFLALIKLESFLWSTMD